MKQIKKETTAMEMYNLQKYFGVQEINMLLGNLESYKCLRYEHTYNEIFDEINNLIK